MRSFQVIALILALTFKAIAVPPGPLFPSIIKSPDGTLTTDVTNTAGLNRLATQAICSQDAPWTVLAQQDGTWTVTSTQGTSPWVVGGTVNAAQSGAWSVSATQGTSPWIIGGTVAAMQSGAWTVTAVQSGTWNQNIAQWGGATTSLGQKTMANSVPVVLASDQSSLPISVQSSTLATYSATANFIPQLLLPTDIFTITGSATKTVKIRRIQLSGINTGNTNALVQFFRRSTANTGGTSTTPTVVQHDTTDVAATAVVRAYTVNPTLGTTVGLLASTYLFLPSLAATNAVQAYSLDFSNLLSEPATLRGTSEVLAVNLNGVTIGGTSTISARIEWTEQ